MLKVGDERHDDRCRTIRDPATSVTNSYGQLHGAANVVAAGGGLFPSIGAVSPAFTVLALANRTAAAMLADWNRFAA